MSLPVYPVFLIFTLFFACLFGLGYYWVSEDIDQNHGIVKMGIIGKLGTAVIIPWAYFINQISQKFFRTTNPLSALFSG